MTDSIDTLYRVFTRAIQHDAATRAEYLDRTCGTNAELRAEAEALLRAHDEPHPFLEDLAKANTTTHDAPCHERLGEFELLREIGSGGTGRVYLAKQASLDRLVAIKAVDRGPGTSETTLDRFMREPRAVARLRHPNIVRILTDGVEGKTYWFAMELIEGHDLATEIRLQRRAREAAGDFDVHTAVDAEAQAGDGGRAHEQSPLLPRFGEAHYIAAAARVCAQAADALREAHACDIIHRDIKPPNLLLDLDGDVHLVDFGLARDLNTSQQSLTAHGIAGTPGYMSPEQARTTQEPIDHRSDIYSIGVVLYELLTLSRPYVGTTWEELRAKIHAGTAPSVRKINPAVPRDLETICTVAMAAEIKARYQSAAALGQDLERFLRHEAIHAKAPHFTQRAWRRIRRNARALTVAAALLIAGTIGALLLAEHNASQARRRIETRFETLLAVKKWDDAAFAELASGLRDARAPGSGELRATLVDAMAARSEGYKRSLLERGRARVQRATAGEGGMSEDARNRLLHDGMVLLYRAAALYPEDREVARAVPEDPFVPRVELHVVDALGNELRGHVRVHALDVETGIPRAPVTLGELPIREQPVPSGLVRFGVTIPGRDERIFTREVVRGSWANRFRFEVRERPARTTKMQRIAGGRFRIPKDERGPPMAMRGRVVDVAPFWLDEHEVTVGQYRDFLRATGHAAPKGWDVISKAGRDTLPVPYVSWEDARTYAEWAGKRLPSYVEWIYVARGSEARRFPWSEVHGFAHGNTRGKHRLPVTMDEKIADFLEQARAVGHDPAARPDAWPVYDLLGNVEEWTESVYAASAKASSSPSTHLRIVAGSTWFARDRKRSLAAIAVFGTGPDYTARFRGFRCARNAQEKNDGR